jgi:hypothetical protein
MTRLTLIRSLRQTLTALRDADSPAEVSRIARILADELEADLSMNPTGNRDHAALGAFPLEGLRDFRSAAHYPSEAMGYSVG